MKKSKLVYLLAGIAAFCAAVALIIVFWDQVTGFVFRIRDKIIGILDSISQRTYIDHYDEYEDCSSWD